MTKPNHALILREENISPDDNERLRQAWLDSAVSFSPDDSKWSPEERKQYAKEWIAGWKKLAEKINRDCVDSRTFREILEEDRNRLEPKKPAPCPALDSKPFYHPKNLAHLHKVAADYKAGRNFAVHELIEVEDE